MAELNFWEKEIQSIGNKLAAAIVKHGPDDPLTLKLHGQMKAAVGRFNKAMAQCEAELFKLVLRAAEAVRKGLSENNPESIP